MIKRRRLEWLGNIAHMPDNKIPRKVFFGWLQQPCPRGGPMRRWKDIIGQDLKNIGVDEDHWYNEAVTSRDSWRALCRRLFLMDEQLSCQKMWHRSRSWSGSVSFAKSK